ncbi:MAG: tetratricopeptide repeat protein [Caldilineaceae bacterium]|nr:tetratricopeptide repeat protein [Caldilineaceae bacterium]
MSTFPAFRAQSASRRVLLLLGVACLSLLVALTIHFFAPPVVQPSAPPAPVERSAQAALDKLQARLQTNPEDTDAYAQLGLGLLQQAREQGDVSLYARAGQAFTAALAREPQQLDALIGQGILALALHDFQGALTWADQAWAINPFRAQILGIKVDAQIELGQYDNAVQTLQQMVDLRPDLDSYSRVSYLRELYGDVDGAITAMQAAVQTALPGTESWAWTLTHVGHLYFNRGNLAQAAALYAQVLSLRDDYPYALAGQARVAAAQGQLAAAIAQYTELTKRLPLPEFIIALGELYETTGQLTAAQQQYALVGVIQQLNAAAGMNVDLEMALFAATHGTDAVTTVSQARAVYAERPTIYGADAVAWALYQQENYAEAWQFSQEALRLGTQDALLYFHAGMIAAKRNDVENARAHLQQALTINPSFSPLYAPIAQKTLAALPNQ